MSKFTLFLIFALSAGTASAEMLTSPIVEVEAAQGNDLHLVYLENGRVLRVTDTEKAAALEGAMLSGQTLNLSVVENNGVDEIQSIAPAVLPQSTALDSVSVEDPYAPTELATLEEATALHNRLTTSTVPDSICANRAHVWSYRMYKDSGVKSMKGFLFFTRRYIRTYRGKWWYHVTPYVHVAGVPYAVDRRFFNKPKELGAWASSFVGNRFACPYIEKYSEYKDQEQTGWCFVRRTPMTVWMPFSVKAMDTQPAPTDFIMSQVRQAVNQALTRKARRNFQY